MEKFWSSSCWKMKGFFSSLLAPGKDQVCLTGGLTECRSLRVVTVIAVWLMFSCDVCVEAWTPAGVEPNCAWHHHLCQLDYVSFSSFVKWATSISTSNENPSPVIANLILNFFCKMRWTQSNRLYIPQSFPKCGWRCQCLQQWTEWHSLGNTSAHGKLWSFQDPISLFAPLDQSETDSLTYSPNAVAEEAGISGHRWISKMKQNKAASKKLFQVTAKFTSLNKMQQEGGLMQSKTTWQSTLYSIVFIICCSDNTALRSFSTRDARNLGLKAICFHAFQGSQQSPKCRQDNWQQQFLELTLINQT